MARGRSVPGRSETAWKPPRQASRTTHGTTCCWERSVVAMVGGRVLGMGMGEGCRCGGWTGRSRGRADGRWPPRAAADDAGGVTLGRPSRPIAPVLLSYGAVRKGADPPNMPRSPPTSQINHIDRALLSHRLLGRSSPPQHPSSSSQEPEGCYELPLRPRGTVVDLGFSRSERRAPGKPARLGEARPDLSGAAARATSPRPRPF